MKSVEWQINKKETQKKNEGTAKDNTNMDQKIFSCIAFKVDHSVKLKILFEIIQKLKWSHKLISFYQSRILISNL